MTEEWEQCEKKLKDVKAWLDKARQSLDSPLNKKRPLRDQLALREKMLGDVTIQKTKINMSIEKLQVHFRSGVTGAPDVAASSAELTELLDQLSAEINAQSKTLEAAVIQLDQLQQVRSPMVNAPFYCCCARCTGRLYQFDCPTRRRSRDCAPRSSRWTSSCGSSRVRPIPRSTATKLWPNKT